MPFEFDPPPALTMSNWRNATTQEEREDPYMPHDKNGALIAVGDLVNIPARVTAIHAGEDSCNCDLEFTERMPPNNTVDTKTCNTRQVIKQAVE
jgi:hypothetical protein